MTVTIGRRELLATLSSAAAAWPFAVRAQQPERMRRVALHLPAAAGASALIVGDCHILLGADLEEPGDARLGWSAVVSNPGRPDLHSSVFKIPHHGSITAHHDDTWQQLITRSPYAAVTPYRLGNNVLP